MDRVTLSLGVRFDWFNASHALGYHLSSVAHHAEPQLRRAGVRSRRATRTWTPKIGAAWDVFGDGKTALKVNFAKYVLGQSLVAQQSARSRSAIRTSC